MVSSFSVRKRFFRSAEVDIQDTFAYVVNEGKDELMKFSLAAMAIAVTVSVSNAQLKSQEPSHPSVAQSLVHPTTSISGFLGWFNPENFMMSHNFSFQYFSGGGNGLSLATYTNSMFYKIADPLNIRFDVSLQGSPFGQYGGGQQGELSRLLLSRAELNYRPWENVSIRLLYRQVPLGGYGLYSPYLPSNTQFGDE